MRLRRTCLSNSGKASQAELDSTVPRQGELERQPRCVQDRPLIFSRFERRDRLLKGVELAQTKDSPGNDETLDLATIVDLNGQSVAIQTVRHSKRHSGSSRCSLVETHFICVEPAYSIIFSIRVSDGIGFVTFPVRMSLLVTFSA